MKKKEKTHNSDTKTLFLDKRIKIYEIYIFPVGVGKTTECYVKQCCRLKTDVICVKSALTLCCCYIENQNKF